MLLAIYQGVHITYFTLSWSPIHLWNNIPHYNYLIHDPYHMNNDPWSEYWAFLLFRSHLNFDYLTSRNKQLCKTLNYLPKLPIIISVLLQFICFETEKLHPIRRSIWPNVEHRQRKVHEGDLEQFPQLPLPHGPKVETWPPQQLSRGTYSSRQELKYGKTFLLFYIGNTWTRFQVTDKKSFLQQKAMPTTHSFCPVLHIWCYNLDILSILRVSCIRQRERERERERERLTFEYLLTHVRGSNSLGEWASIYYTQLCVSVCVCVCVREKFA